MVKYVGTIFGDITSREYFDLQDRDGFSRKFREVESSVKKCLEETLSIKGITNAKVDNDRCPIGLASYVGAYMHSGAIGAPIGVFKATVTGKRKKDVERALYFIKMYLWIERDNYHIEKF
ncbi:MAG: hypothetical protein AABW81_03990 [Nanoarchaeota archaeon]